jgi:hypothetical protein
VQRLQAQVRGQGAGPAACSASHRSNNASRRRSQAAYRAERKAHSEARAVSSKPHILPRTAARSIPTGTAQRVKR